MNKTLFGVMFFTLISTQAFSRNIQGFYINNSGDTSKVIFDIPIAAPNNPKIKNLHFGINYRDQNDVLRSIKPHQAKEVVFIYNNKVTRLLSRTDHLNLSHKMFKKGKSYIFLKLEVDGKLKLFSYYHTQHVSMDFSYESKMMIFQKGNDLLFIPNNYRFRKSIRKFLNDCPELVKKIKKRLYGKGDEVEIARLYNEKCWGKA